MKMVQLGQHHEMTYIKDLLHQLVSKKSIVTPTQSKSIQNVEDSATKGGNREEYKKKKLGQFSNKVNRLSI